MNIQINTTSIQCSWCQSPLASNSQFPEGLRINRIASLGARLMELRQRPKLKRWTISHTVLDILMELAELGASVDEKGFVNRD